MSRIFAPVSEKYPLPCDERIIDIKLKCGSVMIGCKIKPQLPTSILYGFHFFRNYVLLSKNQIDSWREHKDEITIDWPTESNFSFGSDK